MVHLMGIEGARGSVVVKALCYKPKCRERIHSVSEMSTRRRKVMFLESRARPVLV
jgi:hypothetical protein